MEEVKAEPQPKQRTFHWEPKCFRRKEQQLYSGHMIIKAMTGPERQRMLIEDGVFDVEDEVAKEKTGGQSAWLLGIFEKRKDLIIGCDVTRLSDGAKLSLEDVMYEEPLWTMPLEFAGCLVNGFNLGNASRPGSAQS